MITYGDNLKRGRMEAPNRAIKFGENGDIASREQFLKYLNIFGRTDLPGSFTQQGATQTLGIGAHYGSTDTRPPLYGTASFLAKQRHMVCCVAIGGGLQQ
jgi:hypothetical protein